MSRGRKDENGLNISNKVQCEISSSLRGADREQSCGGEKRAKESNRETVKIMIGVRW